MKVFAVAIAAGDIIKYQSFVHGSFVWEIHVSYNNMLYCYIYIYIENISNQIFKLGVSLTHISLASFLWDTGKQCTNRSDAAESGVLSGSPLFANRTLY